MMYIKNQLEKIIEEDIQYTVENISNYFIYNYSFKSNKIHIMTLKISKNILHIELIILPENYRNKGFGSAIVNMIKEWSIQNNYQIIELYAIHESKKFWVKQGFNTVKENNNNMVFYVPKYIK